jgi:uncharacterized membrane protein
MAKTASNTKKKVPTGPITAQAGPLSRLRSLLPWILIIGGALGVYASVAITMEKFDLLSNPHYQPVCDLNPIISCGSVMQSKEAHTFGFMNTYIGMLGFPVLVTVGMAMLAGATLKRWYWWGMQAGLTLGTLFAYWLLYQSVYDIHALCPYCLSVDVAITIMFWYVTLFNFSEGNLVLPRGLKATGGFMKRHHLDTLVLWFLLVIGLILKHFWYYFGHHL